MARCNTSQQPSVASKTAMSDSNGGNNGAPANASSVISWMKMPNIRESAALASTSGEIKRTAALAGQGVAGANIIV